MSIKNSNETIGNQARDLPTSSALPQPAVPPGAPKISTLFTPKFRSAWPKLVEPLCDNCSQ